MTLREATRSSVWLTGCLAVLAAAAWWWRFSVFHAEHSQPAASPWKHVQEQYPLPTELAGEAQPSPELFDAILIANPFSPDRRSVPVSGAPSSERSLASAAAPAPQFVYKGLVKLGNRQRAIVEETTARKTHFLEVGQEVAGF
ncbi:MAG: hypothetical protein Q8R78_04825, partial [Candidatus Omnitrophota bacterium]|nr:hypothetical protein [Candidatus Omnitrophota bacterium]